MKTKHRYRQNISWSVIFSLGLILLANGSFASDLSGYDDLVMLYAGGLSEEEQAAFRQSIQQEEQEALDQILKKELNTTYAERKHIFRQSRSFPTKIFKINAQYTTIGFEKMLNYKGVWEKAAYVLLFENQGPRSLSYANAYLFWKGKPSVQEYSNISSRYLCKEFSALTPLDVCKSDDAIRVASVKKADSDISKPRKKKPRKPVQTGSAIALKVNELDAELHRVNAAVAKKAEKTHTHSGDDIISGIIRESFIDAAVARDRELRNLPKRAAYDELDETYVQSLENRIMELENTIKNLSALLEGVSREQDTVVFSGVNLQIVNGTGSTTGKINGKGNLIVGYNHNRNRKETTKRTGSHNIILGDGHEYTSYGGFVAGLSNTISGAYSSVTGGLRNMANGDYSTVSGGHFKTAEGVYATAGPDSNTSKTNKNDSKGCFVDALMGAY